MNTPEATRAELAQPEERAVAVSNLQLDFDLMPPLRHAGHEAEYNA
jgi:hypothetical protein